MYIYVKYFSESFESEYLHHNVFILKYISIYQEQKYPLNITTVYYQLH